MAHSWAFGSPGRKKRPAKFNVRTAYRMKKAGRPGYARPTRRRK